MGNQIRNPIIYSIKRPSKFYNLIMKTKYYLLLIPILLIGCIGDDFVDDAVEPEIRLTNAIDTLQIGVNYQLEAQYFNNVGQEENVPLQWTSSNPAVVSVTDNGLISALLEGQTQITASYISNSQTVSISTNIAVGNQTVVVNKPRTGTIIVTSNYILEGNFELRESNDQIILSIDDSYKASENLPGLYIYLTNNPNTSVGAFEIGPVNVYNGAHEYVIDNVGLYDYSHVLYFCKPFNVKIGDGIFED